MISKDKPRPRPLSKRSAGLEANRRNAIRATYERRWDGFALEIRRCLKDGADSCTQIARMLNERQVPRVSGSKPWTHYSVMDGLGRYRRMTGIDLFPVNKRSRNWSRHNVDVSRSKAGIARAIAANKDKSEAFTLKAGTILESLLQQRPMTYEEAARAMNELDLKTQQGRMWVRSSIRWLAMRYESLTGKKLKRCR